MQKGEQAREKTAVCRCERKLWQGGSKVKLFETDSFLRLT